MKKFYQSTFPAAAIIAALFMAACDNGTTTAGGVSGFAEKGDVVEWFNAATGSPTEARTSLGFVIVQQDGWIPSPSLSSGQKYGVKVNRGKPYAEVDGEFPLLASGSIVNVTCVGGVAGYYGGYKSVEADGKLPGILDSGALYLIDPVDGAFKATVDGSNKLTTSGIQDGKVYKVEKFDSTSITDLYVVGGSTAAELDVGSSIASNDIVRVTLVDEGKDYYKAVGGKITFGSPGDLVSIKPVVYLGSGGSLASDSGEVVVGSDGKIAASTDNGYTVILRAYADTYHEF